MVTQITVNRLHGDARRELQRAVRSTPDVEVSRETDTGLTIRGGRDRLNELVTSLWVREMSAKDHGQRSLADADESARTRVKQAI